MAKVEVIDQYGTPWLIYPGDPAEPILKQLKGFEYIVLTRAALMTGKVSPVSKPDYSGLEPSVMTSAISEVVKRTTRLYDIAHHLTKEVISGSLR